MNRYCEANPTGLAADLAAKFASVVPVLHTDRLTLRAPRAEDFSIYADIACGPRGEWIGGPMNRDDAWYDFAGFCAIWMLKGHGGWTIELTETGEAIGFAILGAEPGDAEAELGYVISDKHEGQGYASEAAKAARDYALDALQLPSLVSYIHPSNARSIALAKRLGAVPSGTITYPEDDAPSLIYRHPKPEDV